MSKEHIHARQLLAVLRQRTLDGLQPINGYHVAGEAIGLDGLANTRHMGQVCSRIDVAAFNAGLPMVATHMVRTPEGEIHPSAFNQPAWYQFREESIELAAGYQWAAEEFDSLLGHLDALSGIGARAHWEIIERRDAKTPGFIRHNLHRKVKP